MHTVNFISKLKLLHYFHSHSLHFLPLIPLIHCFIPITIKWSFFLSSSSSTSFSTSGNLDTPLLWNALSVSGFHNNAYNLGHSSTLWQMIPQISFSICFLITRFLIALPPLLFLTISLKCTTSFIISVLLHPIILTFTLFPLFLVIAFICLDVPLHLSDTLALQI